MLVVSLKASVFVALYSICTVGANPLPPNAALPSNFVLAPLYTPSPPSKAAAANSVDSHIIPDSYLVILDDELSAHEIDSHQSLVHGLHLADERMRTLKAASSSSAVPELAGIVHKYNVGGKRHHKNRKLRGYSGKFSESTVDAIRALKGVKYVEKDSIVTTQEVEKGAPWGLARISHRKPLSFGTFNRYEYDGHGGEGVDVYVIDTGVNIEHKDLEGRASWGLTVPNDEDRDSNGHGSHVAGTIASATYGVAKQAHIIAVKVLGAGGSGTMSDVVAGVAWAADAAYKKSKTADAAKHKGSVANMSLGGGKSPSLDSAVDSAVDDGLHFAVAAGNDNKDACNYSPAASKEAITVGASTIADERAYFSNHGKCVDVFAPGLQILSIWNSGPESTNSISGTSMASPHVAGLAAYFLSLYPTSFSPSADDFSESVYAPFGASTSSSFGRSAQLVMNKLQSWGIVRRASSAVAPVPKPLTPKALKRAIERVSSKGILVGDLPSGTPNLLIYNNYTAPALQGILRDAAEEEYRITA